MLQFDKTEEFEHWLRELRDKRAVPRILARIRSATHGNFGDCSPVGEGVSEMRIHYGPGYRLYYMRIGDTVYLILIGGDKSTQKRDIKRAIDMARKLRREIS